MDKNEKTTMNETIQQRVFLLYSSHMNTPEEFIGKAYRHSHADCWQLEIMLKGQLKLETREHTYEINPGEMVMIPPRLWHAFIYNDKNVESWSVKFVIEGFKSHAETVVIKDLPPISFFKKQIIKLLPDAMNKTHAVTLEYLLADLIDIQYCENDFSQNIPPLYKEICTLLANTPEMNMPVKEIAKKLGYSKDYLNRFFKNHTGISIKKYIDGERYNLAKKHLTYSNKSISEIAEIMGFPDIFTFSRFFTRLNGDSPRCFRNYLSNSAFKN
jgi:YesN/AraC family two-component response regulator